MCPHSSFTPERRTRLALPVSSSSTGTSTLGAGFRNEEVAHSYQIQRRLLQCHAAMQQAPLFWRLPMSLCVARASGAIRMLNTCAASWTSWRGGQRGDHGEDNEGTTGTRGPRGGQRGDHGDKGTTGRTTGGG